MDTVDWNHTMIPWNLYEIFTILDIFFVVFIATIIPPFFMIKYLVPKFDLINSLAF